MNIQYLKMSEISNIFYSDEAINYSESILKDNHTLSYQNLKIIAKKDELHRLQRLPVGLVSNVESLDLLQADGSCERLPGGLVSNAETLDLLQADGACERLQ